MTKKIPTIELVSEILKKRSPSTWLDVSALAQRCGRGQESVQEALTALKERGVVRSRQDVTLGTVNNCAHHARRAEWQWVRP
jgi:predicted transcriptional regulator